MIPDGGDGRIPQEPLEGNLPARATLDYLPTSMRHATTHSGSQGRNELGKVLLI